MLSKLHSQVIDLLEETFPNHKFFYECSYERFVKGSKDPFILSIAKRLYADIYDNTIGIVYEIQGEQHYRPVEFFGGSDGFHGQKRRDNWKRQVLMESNIDLIEIHYSFKPTKEEILKLIREAKGVNT